MDMVNSVGILFMEQAECAFLVSRIVGVKRGCLVIT